MSDATANTGGAQGAPAPAPEVSALNDKQALAAALADPGAFEAAVDRLLAGLDAAQVVSGAPEPAPGPAPGALEPAPEPAPPGFTPDYAAELAALQQQMAAAQQPVQGGGDEPVRVDPALFGDLSEQSIAQGVSKILTEQRQSLRQQLREEILAEAQKVVESKLQPVAEQTKAQAQSAHEAAILARHGDAHEAVGSMQFRQWLEQLPAFSRQAALDVISTGTSAQVISVLDSFKASLAPAAPASTPTPAPAPTPTPAPAATPVPASLSQIPGAAPAADPFAHMASSDQAALAGVAAMSDQQIERLLQAATAAVVH